MVNLHSKSLFVPLFFQQQINESVRLGIWKIEETEAFFKNNVPIQEQVTHPKKRLQHLAGRFLLQFLAPDFPYELIQIAETRKPYLVNEAYHFSISHCGDYAAAIVSRHSRVGIDVEIPVEKIIAVANKFLSEEEKKIFNVQSSTPDARLLTLCWSAKESVFKWYGKGAVDFRAHIQLKQQQESRQTLDCFFTKTASDLTIHYRFFDSMTLAWVVS